MLPKIEVQYSIDIIYDFENSLDTYTVKDKNDCVIFQYVSKPHTRVNEDNPVLIFLERISDTYYSSRRINKRCNRCSNFSNIVNPVQKRRVGVLGKFVQFVTKFFKIGK